MANSPQGDLTVCRAYKASSGTLSYSWTVVGVDTVAQDPGDNFNAPAYNVPQVGYYAMIAQLSAESQASGDLAQCAIYHSGSRNAAGAIAIASAASQEMISQCAALIYCSQGDTLNMWAQCGGHLLSTNTGTGQTFWCAWRVI